MDEARVIEEVRRRFADIMKLDAEGLDMQARLDDAYGVDSLNALRLVSELEVALDVDIPESLTRYLVEKGSVAVEGISLTVAAIEGTRLRIAIIPFTVEQTNLRTLKAGDPDMSSEEGVVVLEATRRRFKSRGTFMDVG